MPSLRNIRSRTVVPMPRRRFSISIESDTFQQFISPTALLNDNSVNGIAILLQTTLSDQKQDDPHASEQFDAASIAILSTHDLVRIRYGATDDTIWKALKSTEFWERRVWILPIHRPDVNHWVVCVIYPDQKRLHLFDSFAERIPWNVDVNVCILIICSCYSRLTTSTTRISCALSHAYLVSHAGMDTHARRTTFRLGRHTLSS